MSRGPGRVQQAVAAELETHERIYAVDLAAAVYGTSKPNGTQLKAVRRAADPLAEKLGMVRRQIAGRVQYLRASSVKSLPSDMEIRTAPAGDLLEYDVRFDAPGTDGTFTGHAAVFGERNSFNEIVRPGAFARTLAEHRTRNIRPPMLWAHRADEIIGVWTDIREDATGLAVTGQLVTETARGKEAHALLKAGALNGLSIGFRARAADRDKSGLRILTDIELVEISLVALPSAGNARIKQVRSDSDFSTFTRAIRACTATLRKD